MRFSLLLIFLHLFRCRAASLRLICLLAMLASQPLHSQESGPRFRIGDIVWTSSYSLSYQTTTHALYDTRNFISIYTHGAGVTNEETKLNSATLLDLSLLPLYYNRYQFVQGSAITNEWTWQDGGLLGVWYSDTTFVRDTYIYNLAPLDLQSGLSVAATPRTFLASSPPDFSNGFKGPVGSVLTTNELGGVTTDTYTTTAGLYVPGDPASTNEHFYRVQLSLEYSDHTPIAISRVTNYLGQPPDLNSNVYVWLREGQEYTAKPTFSTASPPSFYSYSAEATRGDQLGTLIISTIAANPDWPGTRPEGLATRLAFAGTGLLGAFSLLLLLIVGLTRFSKMD